MDGNHKDIWMWIGGGLATLLTWLFKKVNTRIDRAHDRIEKLGKDVFEEFRKSNDDSHKNMKDQLNRIEGKLEKR